MSGNQSPSTASMESNTSDKTTFIGNIDATTTSFDKRDSQNVGKENWKNKEEKTEEKIKGLKHQDKKKKAASPRSNKDKEEEKEPPMKKQKSSPSTTASGIIFLPRITRLEAELAAALTKVAQLKSELDELKATMAKIASRG